MCYPMVVWHWLFKVIWDDLLSPSVDVIDVGLSDHHLLQWSVPMSRPPPVYNSVDVRQWRLLDHDAFRAALSSSFLCNPDAWSDRDAHVPQRDHLHTRSNGASAPAFFWPVLRRGMSSRQASCTSTGASVHARVALTAVPAAADVAAAAAFGAAWRTERRELCDRKREAFWWTKVDVERSSPERGHYLPEWSAFWRQSR